MEREATHFCVGAWKRAYFRLHANWFYLKQGNALISYPENAGNEEINKNSFGLFQSLQKQRLRLLSTNQQGLKQA